MKFTLLFLGLFIGMSCNSSKINTVKTTSNDSDECKEYFGFIKSQWTGTNKLYSFQGDPEYWKEYNKYNRFDCIKGKSTFDIEALFGTPTKQFIFPEFTMWVYCMSEECKEAFSEYKNKKELVINFDQTEKVKAMYFNPSFHIQN